MTHSKMVQTRRQRKAATKRRLSVDKLAKKLRKRSAPSESPQVSPPALAV